MLLTFQRFGDLFYLGWTGSILQIRTNIIKVGSKSWLLTCSSNINLSLPSYTGSALKRELNFYKGYLGLQYFWPRQWYKILCYESHTQLDTYRPGSTARTINFVHFSNTGGPPLVRFLLVGISNYAVRVLKTKKLYYFSN